MRIKREVSAAYKSPSQFTARGFTANSDAAPATVIELNVLFAPLYQRYGKASTQKKFFAREPGDRPRYFIALHTAAGECRHCDA